MTAAERLRPWTTRLSGSRAGRRVLGRARGAAVRSAGVGRRLTAVYTRYYYYRGMYDGGTWRRTTWLGVPVLKFPTDLWAYQELLHEVRPDLLVETGTHLGGSALYFAGLFDAIGAGQVLTVDVAHPAGLPDHPRIEYLTGSSTDPAVVEQVRRRCRGAGRVLVVLDSDHRAAHVADELAAYADLVTDGSYLVVEDGCVNGHPVLPEHGPGPLEALQDFLAARDDFVADRSWERYLVTNNPSGFLRRTRPPGGRG